MDITLKSQFFEIGLSVIYGVFLGVVYHCIILLENILLLLPFEINCKKLSKFKVNYTENNTRKIMLFFCDLLYYVIITPISAVFVFGISEGIVRAYLFVGCFVGLIMYFFTIGKIIRIVVNYLSLFVHATVLRFIVIMKFKLKDLLKKRKEKGEKNKMVYYAGINKEQG